MLSIDDRRPGPEIPRDFNLARHVLAADGAGDDKLALIVLRAAGAERWSYGRLRNAVLTAAGTYLSRGLKPGDRLLMRIGNSPDFPVAYLGAIAAGILPAPTSAALSAKEITRIAARLNPTAVVAGPGVALPDHPCPVIPVEELKTGEPLSSYAETRADDPAYIIFTSGTSGEPLGVIHAHRALAARAMMVNGWYGLTAGDRVLHAGAFNWTYTLGTGLLDPWTNGATALVLAKGAGLDLLPLLAKRHDATILAGAPGVFRRLLANPLPPLPKLRHGLSAGEKLSDDLRGRWRQETGTDLHEAFGQTECSTFISGAPDRPAPPGTLGFAQEGRAVAILGPEGPVERGEVGDIAIHRTDPGLRLGYLDRPVRTEDEWVRTGDTGLMRADSTIEYHGRNDDILTAGGFRISPLEIEAAMTSHPHIDEAAAVDHRIDPDTTIIALYYTGKELSEDELKSQADLHLARYKQPRRFIHVTSLPRNANGKLLRKTLRAANEGP